MRKLVFIILLVCMVLPIFGQVIETKENEVIETEKHVDSNDIIKKKMQEMKTGLLFYQKAENDTLLYFKPYKSVGLVAGPMWLLSAYMLLDGMRVKTNVSDPDLKEELKSEKRYKIGGSAVFALTAFMLGKASKLEAPVQYEINGQTHYLTTSFKF